MTRPISLRSLFIAGACILAGAGLGMLLLRAGEMPADNDGKGWQVHDRSRPQPPVVTPGTFSTQDTPGTPPSDAIILFDGKDLSQWKADKDGGQPKWKVESGYFEIVKGTGSISTRESFGDIQLHAEWMAPNPPVGTDQDRGNSGIFFQSRFELQVLDNYQAQTYPDGMAGAIYGQYPPQVNAARPPGQWQTYDVIFHAPRFSDDGKLLAPARETVFFNGILVQDNVELKGPTQHMNLAGYSRKSPEKAPLSLQDHGHPVRYRNIWVRQIATDPPAAPTRPGRKD